MGVISNPSLTSFIAQNQNNLEALSHFVVDNNTTAVFAVLRSNGYTFNTPGEASIIVRSLLTSTNSKDLGIVSQLSKIPYINDATNGTGGVTGQIGGISTLGAGDDLLCLGSKLFGLSIGCPVPPVTADSAAQAAALKAAQDKEAAQQKVIYWTIGIAAVVLLLVVIYFTRKQEPKK